MNQVKWENKFETGNGLVDSQHKLFIEKINRCIVASRSNASRDDLLALLQDIQECLVEHFRDEEDLMAKTSLSSHTHLSQHAHISQRLDTQITAFKQNNEKEKTSVQHILFSLYDWYSNHALAEDSCFCPQPQASNN